MKREKTAASRKLNRFNISKLPHGYFEVMIFEPVDEENFEYMKYEDTKQVSSFDELVRTIVQTRYDCDDSYKFSGVYTPEEADEIERFVLTAKELASEFFSRPEDKGYVTGKFEVIRDELKSTVEQERLDLLENAVQDLILMQMGGD